MNQSNPSRRDFLQALCGGRRRGDGEFECRPQRACLFGRAAEGGFDRLRRARRRRGHQPADRGRRQTSSWWPWPTFSKTVCKDA